jgi:GTP-binding protein HflX
MLDDASPTAVLIGVDFGDPDFKVSLEELVLLTESAGAVVVDVMHCKRHKPDVTYFVGSGKVDEIKMLLDMHNANHLIVNHHLGAAQQRNLERKLQVRVVDRTALILDIFAQRAKSHVGKLQVELAQLQYQSTRLVKAWSHLEGQKGGIGLRGGPGEKQMELDRRILDGKIANIKQQLKTVEKQRQTQRRSRVRQSVFRVSIVGYTNAGKSTLFNRLTSAKEYVADQLFATLDTTSRRLYLGQDEADRPVECVMSDTVGFIRDLPHGLIEAFKATLEETIHADLLLHVVDSSSAVHESHIEQVNVVLTEIQAQDLPQLIVFNKIDLTDQPFMQHVNEMGCVDRIALSAQTNVGIPELRQVLFEYAVTHARSLRQRDEGYAQQWLQAQVEKNYVPSNTLLSNDQPTIVGESS